MDYLKEDIIKNLKKVDFGSTLEKSKIDLMFFINQNNSIINYLNYISGIFSQSIEMIGDMSNEREDKNELA